MNTSDKPGSGPDSGHESSDEDFALWQQKVHGTNISDKSLLATDYLNHFSEIVMLLELVADMPECVDEVRSWQAKSYCDHFRGSSFSDRELAIAAYDHVPPRFKEPFEETVAHMDGLVTSAIQRLDAAIEDGAPTEEIGEVARTSSRNLQRLMDHASSIIHGNERPMDQAEIDALMGDT